MTGPMKTYWYYDWPRECKSWRSWAWSSWGHPYTWRSGWRLLGVVKDYQPKVEI